MSPLLFFYIGILIQAIFLLGYNFEKKDALKILGCIGFAIFAMLPGKHEYNYDLFFHFFIFAIFFSGCYSFVFKNKLLQEINKDILLVWNLILVYIILKSSIVYIDLLVLVGVLSLPTIINVFFSLDRKYAWRVFFYIWFLCIIVAMASSHIAFRNMSFFFNKGAGMPTDNIQMFLLGASLLYLIANLMYLLELIPFTSKHQSFSNRIANIKEDMRMLASRYEIGDRKLTESFFVTAITITLLWLNHIYKFINDSSLVYLLIASTPVIDRFLFKGGTGEEKVYVDPDTQIETIYR